MASSQRRGSDISASLSDGLLLEALQKGDENSFEELFLRHRSQVYRLALRLVGDREEAEELTQEVFLKLYRHRFKPREEHNLIAWLYRVATNLSFNALRSRRRRLERTERAAISRPVEGFLDNPEAEAIRTEEREMVQEILDTLPESQRACLVLRQVGLSYAEISQVIGVSPGSVGTLLARGERSFKERYLARQRKEM